MYLDKRVYFVINPLLQVITVDIHSPQTEGFFTVPVDCLTARFLFER